ncbi:hypothetical protein [Salinibacter ruber]|uniref:hypothetical protein n=1 Tax=Salinibacter ruber TaxID=146919 RepID=UPI002073600C|nr:hypothetical protein [Salinibacter ruber]
MPWYALRDETWTDTEAPAPNGRAVQIQAEDASTPPTIRVLTENQERLHLTGADPRPQTDTTHTVAWGAPDSTGRSLFAVHAQGNDLIFDDRRPADAPDSTEAALDQVQSSLSEIMIPVYIDDVIEDLSDTLPGLVVLHTVQYEAEGGPPWTYFRTTIFENGDLALEDEYGEL